jgi:dTDP-glucose pyrophosphorylase
MKAIIPVAGVGSRLRPHTYTLPKVLLNVAGKPIIGHIIDKIIAEGIKEAVVVVGYLGDMIEDYLTRHYDIHFTFVEQEERLGLGHAIWITRQYVGEDPVLIILGDTIFEVDLSEVLRREHSALGVKAVEDPRRFGVAEVQDGFITQLVEKPEHPRSNLAVVGLYYIKRPALLMECLDRNIQANLRTKGEFQLTDALQAMIERGENSQLFLSKAGMIAASLKLCSRPMRNCSNLAHDTKIFSAASLTRQSISPRTPKSKTLSLDHMPRLGSKAVVKNSLIKNSIVGEQARVISMLLSESIIGNNANVLGKLGASVSVISE